MYKSVYFTSTSITPGTYSDLGLYDTNSMAGLFSFTVPPPPVSVVSVLLNGANQDVTLPTPTSTFTLQSTGTNNPTACYMNTLLASTGQWGKFYVPYICSDYINPSVVSPRTLGFTVGQNAISIIMKNAGGYSSPGVHTITIPSAPPSVPTVIAPTSAFITTTSATLGANVASSGNPALISTRGVCFGSAPIPTNCVAEGGVTAGVFTQSVVGLAPGTLYYYRGYATNSTGTGYSSDGTFTTLLLPDITSSMATPVVVIVGTPLTFSGTISNIGAGSTGASFSNFFQVATAASGGGTITDLTATTMTTLPAGATGTATSPSYTFSTSGTYSVRACADKSSSANLGTIAESNETNNCGAWTTVTVAAATVVPTVTTPTATAITVSGATLGANVTSLGTPATITARGTCLGASASPMTNCVAEGNTSTGVFTQVRTGLLSNTLYYYRGYATNSTGTGYSSDGTFTTATPMYSMSTVAGTGGSISPTSATVAQGGSASFTVTPNTGYSTIGVSVDGMPQGPLPSYTFTNVQANHQLTAFFASSLYTITASSGLGGSISPTGSVLVNRGSNQAFTITPSAGYSISSVSVDGVNQGPLPSYTFTNVQAAHTIDTVFTANTVKTRYQQF